MSREAPRFHITLRQPGKSDVVDLENSSTKVMSVEFADHEKKVDTLNIQVDNWDLANFDDPVWAHGNTLDFVFGYANRMSPDRRFIIRKVTGGQTLTIEAHAESVKMDKKPKTRKFLNSTRSQVIRQIAREAGYSARDTNIEDTTEVFEVITQSNLTDAQFVRKLAHLEGFQFRVGFDGFRWHRRKVGQAPIRKLIYYTDPGRGDILDFSVTNDITRRPGRTKVKGRDPERMENIDETADNSTETDRGVLQKKMVAIGTFDGETGDLNTQQVAAQDEERPSNVQTREDARREAKGRFIRSQQVAVKMDMTIVGDPDMLAMSVIEIEGMGKRLSGKYYVKSATHLWGAAAPTTQLELITDGFQSAYGASNEFGALQAALAGCYEELIAIVSSIKNSTIRGRTEAFGQLIYNLGNTLDSSDALKVVRAGKQLAIYAKSVGETAAAEIYLGCVAIARRLLTKDEEDASGKANTNEPRDPGELTPVGEIEGEGGTLRIDRRGLD